jgi:hypothetical protein
LRGGRDTCSTYSRCIVFLYSFGLISINDVGTWNKLRVQRTITNATRDRVLNNACRSTIINIVTMHKLNITYDLFRL